MYQALRSLGVDTQLVIYPNQYHGITTPSYEKDRLERYVAWYDKYLKPKVQGTVRRIADASLRFRRAFAPMTSSAIASASLGNPSSSRPGAFWLPGCGESVGRSPSTAPMCSSLSAWRLAAWSCYGQALTCCFLPTYNSSNGTYTCHHQAGCRGCAAYRSYHSAHRRSGIPDPCHAASCT